jgi:hypothetical protein
MRNAGRQRRRLTSQLRWIRVRARAVTRRQAAALSAAAVLGAILVTATVAGRGEIAVLAVGLVGVLVLVIVVQVRRRMVQQIRAVMLQNANLAKQLEIFQRRVVAALENVRLEEADRFRALVANLDLKEASNQTAYRRILGAIESERLAAAERQRQLISQLGGVGDAIQEPTGRGVTMLDSHANSERNLVGSGVGDGLSGPWQKSDEHKASVIPLTRERESRSGSDPTG